MQSISKSIKIDQWDGSVNGSISRNHYSCFNFQLQSRPVHSTWFLAILLLSYY